MKSATTMSLTKFPTVTLIHLTTMTGSENGQRRAERIARALNGKSYMNLRVEICPYAGELRVNVVTLRPDTTESDLTAMVLGLLADEVGGS